MAEPLGSRFTKLWTASTTSALGSGLATIAAPLFVAAHTKSPLIVSATFGVAWLPWLLFALPGGVLVDRVDRRRLMVTIDGIRVAAVATLATALLTGWSSIALLDASWDRPAATGSSGGSRRRGRSGSACSSRRDST